MHVKHTYSLSRWLISSRFNDYMAQRVVSVVLHFFGLWLWKHFNFSPGSVLLSNKSHANATGPQVEPSQSVSRAGIRHGARHWWLRPSLKPNTIWRTGQPPLLYLSIFMQCVPRILNTHTQNGQFLKSCAVICNDMWGSHALSAMYVPLYHTERAN